MGEQRSKVMCPVCGYSDLDGPLADNICPCCGVQFNYHDMCRSHADLRAQWLADGAPWHFRHRSPPANWNVESQLAKAYLHKEQSRHWMTEELHRSPESSGVSGETLVAIGADSVAFKLDWQQTENRIYNAVIKYLEDFSTRHPDDAFYGFFIECQASSFQLIGRFNATEPMRRDWSPTYPRRHPQHVAAWTLEQLEGKARWANRDWGDCETFDPRDYDAAYNQIATKVIEWADSFPGWKEKKEGTKTIADQFLLMACRVALRLENMNAFAQLNTTRDFRVLCADSDEALIVAERRLLTVRVESLES